MMRAMALLFIFHLSLITSTAQELVVTVDTVGQLATRLPDSLRFSMTELKITGPLGGNDMKLLQSILKNPRQKKPTDKVLTAIDLSEVSVQDSRGSFHTKADMLPASMFLGCKNLERVSLPAALTEVSISCFSGCVNLKEVELPGGMRCMGHDLLHNIGKGRLESFDNYGIWDFLAARKAEGLIKHLGFSAHASAEMLLSSMRTY